MFRVSGSSRVDHASSIVLVAAVQTRSNNRVVFAASADVFSDAYYMENPDNRVLGDQLSLCEIDEAR